MNLCKFLWVTLTQLEVFCPELWPLTLRTSASSMSSFSHHFPAERVNYASFIRIYLQTCVCLSCRLWRLVFFQRFIFVNVTCFCFTFSNMFSSLVMNEFIHTFWDHFHADWFCSSLFDKSTLFISVQSEKILINVNIRLIKSVLFEMHINLCKWLLFITWQRKQPRGGNTIFTLFAQTHYQIIKV